MRIFNYLLTTFFALLLTATAWSSEYKGVTVVKSNTMKELDGVLSLTLEVAVHGKAVANYGAVRLTPKLVGESKSRRFGSIMIQGENKRRTYNRWMRTMSKRDRALFERPIELVRVKGTTDTTIYFNAALPYEEWMDGGVLAVEQELITYRDDRSLFIFALDGRVELEYYEPYEPSPRVYFIEPKAEQKVRSRQGKAYLDFQKGSSTILPGYRRNPSELKKIERLFDDIINSADAQIKGLYIEGYASPEGSYETNERLARERATALKDYLLYHYKAPVLANQIKVSSIAEDWDGLVLQLRSSNIARKNEVIEIIENTVNIAQRKSKIQLLAGGSIYHTMLQEIYPQLRRVEYQIEFAVKDYSVQEAKDLIGKNTDLLSHQELCLVAQHYGDGSEEFENIILDIAPTLFPDDYVAKINAAAQMIRRGELMGAKRLLEEHRDNPAAYNNLGVIYLLEGKLDQAERLFRLAMQNNIEPAEHNLREVETKREDNQRQKRYER